MKRRIIFGLSGISIVLFGIAIFAILQVHATADEEALRLAGDDLIPHPIGSVNHAITIHRPPRDVWPWLVQMGSGRAGWYAYDFIDNGGHPSSNKVVPEFQAVKVGDVFPALPGQNQVFSLMRLTPERDLVLGWRQPNGNVQTSWAFVLFESRPGETRIVVRGRIAEGYTPLGLPQWIAVLVAKPAHFIMERKQLLGLARRVEQ